MNDIDDTTKADALLLEHYYWQKAWKAKLGYGNAAPECRQAVSSRQWDTTAEITSDTVDQIEMETVDWCVDALDGESRRIIGCEMRNREVAAKVWHSETGRTYADAVNAILPFMRKKNLL
jgi:hypothetical protein